MTNFFDLPRELRDKVYEQYVLDATSNTLTRADLYLASVYGDISANMLPPAFKYVPARQRVTRAPLLAWHDSRMAFEAVTVAETILKTAIHEAQVQLTKDKAEVKFLQVAADAAWDATNGKKYHALEMECLEKEGQIVRLKQKEEYMQDWLVEVQGLRVEYLRLREFDEGADAE